MIFVQFIIYVLEFSDFETNFYVKNVFYCLNFNPEIRIRGPRL